MPRLPYLPEDITEPGELLDSIRARRAGSLLHLDRMLLHSPSFARGWNALLGEVRGNLSLPPQLRELAICAVAVLTRADYELHHHSPEFLKAGGSEQQLEALRLLTGNNDELAVFNPAEQAVLQLAVEMTLQVEVSDRTFAEVAIQFPSRQQQVDLIAVIATYNMVSRYLVALQIEPEKIG